MKEKQIKKLIDEGAEIAIDIKRLEDELDVIKVDLKKYAQETNRRNIKGNVFYARVSPTSGADCKPKDFYDVVKKLDLGDDVFYSNIKVNVGTAKTAIGEAHFGPISKTWSKPYNMIKFSELSGVKKPVNFDE